MGRGADGENDLVPPGQLSARSGQDKVVLVGYYDQQDFVDRLVDGFDPRLHREQKRSAAEIIVNAVDDPISEELSLSLSRLRGSLEDWSSSIIYDMEGQGRAEEWAGVEFLLSLEDHKTFSELVKQEGDDQLARNYREWLEGELDQKGAIAAYLKRERREGEDAEWEAVEEKIEEVIANYTYPESKELERSLYDHGFMDFDDWQNDFGRLESIEFLRDKINLDAERFLESVYGSGSMPQVNE